MKDITEELVLKGTVVCVSCGRFYEGRDIHIPCPNCGAERNGLYHITEGASWLECVEVLTQEKQRKED